MPDSDDVSPFRAFARSYKLRTPCFSIHYFQVNERDTAKLDEMKEADGSGGDDQRNSDRTYNEDDGDAKPAPFVEVANVRVGSMVRMATVDK